MAESIFTLARIGLVLNIIGTVMIAFAFGENPAGANQKDRNGRPIYLASFLRPWMFRWGLVVLGTGFACQVIA